MKSSAILVALLLSGVASTACGQDLLIHGGPIYTGLSAGDAPERVDYVVVREGRIVHAAVAEAFPALASRKS